MKKLLMCASAAIAMFAVSGAQAGTLDDVKAKGEVACVVSTGIAGFAYTDADGNWKGRILLQYDFHHYKKNL